MDKTSYALGLSFGQMLHQQGVKGINYSDFAAGIEAMCEGKQPAIELNEARTLLNEYANKVEEEQKKQYAEVKTLNENWLAENKKREGIITTASGLQYEILTEGNGEKPTVQDRVKVHYEGKLIDGTIFDSSIRRGEPTVFGLTQVISGWTEALQLMAVGSKYRLYLPSNLAYGEQGAGEIKPFSTLIFDVELLGIEK
ncbi:MAG: FKBP-type peptidyl-prolyl cis-trans isomerase [Bacteroidales bacterium]|nr:FKBP-type peptidyl-prolyl cis-trans isomerase [Bacteroidales bacterium]